MSNNKFSDSIKQLQQWQREYKTAQSRLASSLKVYEASISVTVQSGGHTNVWMNANPETVLATCLLPSVDIAQMFGVYIRPIYDSGGGGRCGFAIYNYYGNAPSPLEVKVQANQEISLSVN